MLIDYKAIITASIRETFNDYINALDIPEIDYFAIGVQNYISKTSISLMSNTEWQKIFVENNYAQHDPLRKSTILTKRNIISFSELDTCCSFGKEIMRQRAKNFIKNGIVFMERYKKYSYMVTLGTAFSGFKSYDFLKKYHDKIKVMKNELIKIIEPDARAFINPTVIHPYNDAK